MHIRNHYYKKQFGQNFLRNKKTASRLISILEIGEEDLVIEIGPGDGFITEELVKTTNDITLIEIDEELNEHLKEKFKENNLQIINKDFFSLDLNKYLIEQEVDKNKIIKIIGNLPYNVSKDIILDLFHFAKTTEYKVKLMCFIVQEEVSQSYVSKPPKTTPLSAVAQIYSKPKKYETVSRKYFEPSPKVAGGIISFAINDSIPESSDQIEKLISIGFSSPRKTLQNNIKNSRKYENVDLAFEAANINPNIRSSELTVSEWIALESHLQKSE